MLTPVEASRRFWGQPTLDYDWRNGCSVVAVQGSSVTIGSSRICSNPYVYICCACTSIAFCVIVHPLRHLQLLIHRSRHVHLLFTSITLSVGLQCVNSVMHICIHRAIYMCIHGVICTYVYTLRLSRTLAVTSIALLTSSTICTSIVLSTPMFTRVTRSAAHPLNLVRAHRSSLLTTYIPGAFLLLSPFRAFKAAIEEQIAKSPQQRQQQQRTQPEPEHSQQQVQYDLPTSDRSDRSDPHYCS